MPLLLKHCLELLFLVAAIVGGRTSDQCLHRYVKTAKPGLRKGPWTAEENEVGAAVVYLNYLQPLPKCKRDDIHKCLV